MKKILVPTDFSPNAERAIDYAVQIAKLNQATIYLIHACDHLDTLYMEGAIPKAEYNKTIADEAFNNLEILRRSIEEPEQVLVNIQLYSGPINDTILVAAEEHQADLVIMGTLGVSGLKEKIFGSKTASIISNSKIPVLAIPLEYDWSTPVKFLLAINHFDEDIDTLKPLFDLARVFNTEVQVTIFTDEDVAGASDFLKDAKEIEFMEEKLKKEYEGITITAKHLSGRYFEESITEYIDKNNIDLLAMTTHKRSLISSIFNRSITRKMSYHAKVPVLAIPVQ